MIWLTGFCAVTGIGTKHTKNHQNNTHLFAYSLISLSPKLRPTKNLSVIVLITGSTRSADHVSHDCVNRGYVILRGTKNPHFNADVSGPDNMKCHRLQNRIYQ